MKKQSLATLCVLSASVAFGTHAEAAVYTFFDTTFTNSDWTGTLYTDTSSPAATFTSAQSSTNGGSPITPPAVNNGLYRETTHNFGGGSGGAIVVTHQNNVFSWSPLVGETIATVGYRYDAQYDSGTFAGAVGYDPAIFQGGNVYRLVPFDNVTKREWTRFTLTGIPLSSFELITPSTGFTVPGMNPANNLPLTVGYVSANSASTPAFKTSGLDNYGFSLTTVPEPTSLAMIGLGALYALRRRRTPIA